MYVYIRLNKRDQDILSNLIQAEMTRNSRIVMITTSS
jgi:hypothetical protein